MATAKKVIKKETEKKVIKKKVKEEIQSDEEDVGTSVEETSNYYYN